MISDMGYQKFISYSKITGKKVALECFVKTGTTLYCQRTTNVLISKGSS